MDQGTIRGEVIDVLPKLSTAGTVKLVENFHKGDWELDADVEYLAYRTIEEIIELMRESGGRDKQMGEAGDAMAYFAALCRKLEVFSDGDV